MNVSKANYAPFNSDILSFPTGGILASENDEGRKPGDQDEQLVSSTPVLSGDISSDGASGSTSQLKPGYKSFNLALLGGFNQPTVASQNPATTRSTTPGPGSETTASKHVPTPESPAISVGFRDGSDGYLPGMPPYVDNEQRCPNNSQGSNPMPLHSTKAHSIDQRDINPFRRARLSTDLSASSTADDAACGLFNEAGCFPATPREQFSAALAMRGVAANMDPPMRGHIPNPRAEVDPEDYG